MSTMAWDGHIMAASRLSLGEDGLCEQRKVMRHGGSIYAALGHANAIERLFAWVMGQSDFPQSCNGILIEVSQSKPGKVYIYKSEEPHEMDAWMIAFGSGKDKAIKILTQGANAIDAVRYASVWDDLTAGGIDVVGWKWETTNPVDMPDLERLRVLE